MKKFLKSIIPVFALCFACLSFSTTAKAGDITSLSVSASADSVTVEGKTEAGVYAVAITVYEKESKELVKYFTAQVLTALLSVKPSSWLMEAMRFAWQIMMEAPFPPLW